MIEKQPIRIARGWAYPLLLLSFLALAGCGDGPKIQEHPWNEFHFPTHLTVSPDGSHLHIVNSNFNLLYRTGAMLTVDLATHEFVESGYLPLPSFAGKTVLHQHKDGSWSSYWPDREGGKLLWADYLADEDEWFTCDRTGPNGRCSEAFQAWDGTRDNEAIRMETDPYAIGAVNRQDGRGAFLLTGGLLDPKLTLWEIGEEGKPSLQDQITVANGLSGVAVHPVTGAPYLTAQYAQAVYAIDLETNIEELPTISQVSTIALPNETRIGRPIYGQDIAFDRLGALAFVPYRYPSSIAVIDVSPDAHGNPTNILLGFTEAGANPTGVEVVQLGPDKEMLYVSSASRGEIYAYSLPDMQLMATIDVGRGASHMASFIDLETGISRLYVSLFEEAGVAVVDIAPDSPWYHQLIATIR